MNLPVTGGANLDERGAGAVEFALLTPVLLLSLLGVFDLGYNLHTQSLLEGAIQQAARASTLEDAEANTATIDAQVSRAVKDITPGATVTFQRSAYTSFSSVNKPEPFTDTNRNGRCDSGEPYEDVNENRNWDTNQGRAGLGGSRDVVLYVVNVTYPRAFPVPGLTGSTFSMQAKTVLGNQPWDNIKKTPPVRNCT